MKTTFLLLVSLLLLGCAASPQDESKWTPLFNGKDLTGWTVRGKATWSVQEGVLVGVGGMDHIYTDVACADFELKGKFRITEQGREGQQRTLLPRQPAGRRSGRLSPRLRSADLQRPRACTGWLWKPAKPTGQATELLTKDGEWFEYRIRAVREHIQFWINDKLVMTYDDTEYISGHFAIQGHNPGMMGAIGMAIATMEMTRDYAATYIVFIC